MRVLRFAQEPGSDKGDGCDNSYNSKGKNKYRSSSPFDYAQGQDDGVKQTTTSAKATATATATTKYGDPSPFGFAQGQDDDVGGLNS
jgi:hypothetical protein